MTAYRRLFGETKHIYIYIYINKTWWIIKRNAMKLGKKLKIISKRN